MLPTDFSSWTREQWAEFDAIRSACCALTQAEIDAQNAAIAQAKLDKANTVLASYGLTMPEIVDKPFLLQFAEVIDAKQFVWDVSVWIDWQIALHWDTKTWLIEVINQYF